MVIFNEFEEDFGKSQNHKGYSLVFNPDFGNEFNKFWTMKTKQAEAHCLVCGEEIQRKDKYYGNTWRCICADCGIKSQIKLAEFFRQFADALEEASVEDTVKLDKWNKRLKVMRNEN